MVLFLPSGIYSNLLQEFKNSSMEEFGVIQMGGLFCFRERSGLPDAPFGLSFFEILDQQIAPLDRPLQSMSGGIGWKEGIESLLSDFPEGIRGLDPGLRSLLPPFLRKAIIRSAVAVRRNLFDQSADQEETDIRRNTAPAHSEQGGDGLGRERFVSDEEQAQNAPSNARNALILEVDTHALNEGDQLRAEFRNLFMSIGVIDFYHRPILLPHYSNFSNFSQDYNT